MNDPARPQPAGNAPAQSSPALSRLAAAPSGAPDLRLRVAHLSDLGRARDHQEDAVGVFAPTDPLVLARKGHLLIVADGMGGHQAGEVASQLAVAEMPRAYYADPGDDATAALAQALQTAHQAIYRHAQTAHNEQGMGTTVAIAVIRGHHVQVANIGDSRIYLLRDRSITQITEDHSWVASQVRAGILTPEQAANHPQRNLVLRALGKGGPVEPDFFSGELQAGDVLLLCSDGLTRHVSDRELLEIAGAAAPDVAVRRLVDLANSRGGSDNISVIVARAELPAAVPAAASAAALPAASAARLSPRLIALLIGALVVLVVSALLLALLLKREPEGQEPRAGQPAATVTARASDTPTPGATTAPPTATLAPTGEPAAAGQGSAALLAAPTELRINGAESATLTGADRARFTWRWAGRLPAGYAFEVRIWKNASDAHQGAAEADEQRQGNLWTQTIEVGQAPAVQGGDGEYRWTVAVVQRAPYRRVGAEAEPGVFRYTEAQPAAPGALPTQAAPSGPVIPKPTSWWRP